MELSMATDYASDTGNAEPYLRRIAAAGFRHIQWIHHRRHDFIYTAPEIAHIAEVMLELGLSLYDLHAPTGSEKNWFALVEYQRRAGVEIIKNRVEMCRALGGSVIVVHIPSSMPENAGKCLQLKKSLWELEEFCVERGVRIAVENRPKDKFAGINQLLADNPADFLGLCYDSGHGNIGGKGLNYLDVVKERLISVHLHDNDGLTDQHKPLFTGTIDWVELMRIVGQSPYDEYLTIETDMRHSGFRDEDPFLASAYADGMKLLQMM